MLLAAKMARYPCTIVAALLALGGADAMSMMVLPQETTVGLVAPMGVSPRPTHPPGVPEGIPKELVRRSTQSVLPYPPPGYYCGLVNSDPSLSPRICDMKTSIYPVI
jgi:hypothetical protein